MVAPSERRSFHAGQGFGQGRSFVERLLVFAFWIGVPDDSRAHMITRLAAAADDGPNRDAHVTIAIETDIAQRARVEIAALGLEFVDDLHGPDFRRPRDRSARKSRPQAIKDILAGPQPAAYGGDEMMHGRM